MQLKTPCYELPTQHQYYNIFGGILQSLLLQHIPPMCEGPILKFLFTNVLKNLASWNMQASNNIQSKEAMRCAVFSLDGRVLFDGDVQPGQQSLYLGHSGWAVVRCISQAGKVWTNRVLMPQ